MDGMPIRSKSAPGPSPGGVVAGLFVSMIAVRFASAAWAAAQREGARQRMASSR
jgi:hypothetical protein